MKILAKLNLLLDLLYKFHKLADRENKNSLKLPSLVQILLTGLQDKSNPGPPRFGLSHGFLKLKFFEKYGEGGGSMLLSSLEQKLNFEKI